MTVSERREVKILDVVCLLEMTDSRGTWVENLTVRSKHDSFHSSLSGHTNAKSFCSFQSGSALGHQINHFDLIDFFSSQLINPLDD